MHRVKDWLIDIWQEPITYVLKVPLIMYLINWTYAGYNDLPFDYIGRAELFFSWSVIAFFTFMLASIIPTRLTETSPFFVRDTLFKKINQDIYSDGDILENHKGVYNYNIRIVEKEFIHEYTPISNPEGYLIKLRTYRNVISLFSNKNSRNHLNKIKLLEHELKFMINNPGVLNVVELVTHKTDKYLLSPYKDKQISK